MENRFYIPVPEDPHLLLGAAGTLARSSVRKRSFGFLFRLREEAGNALHTENSK